MNYANWLSRREYGRQTDFGDGNTLMRRIYHSISPYYYWNQATAPDRTSEFGSIYNLDFSPHGNVLVAACERKSLLLYDSLSRKLTNKIVNAHTDGVTNIRFLDDRMFASCSDDTTVAIWDLRYMKSKVRCLRGHSGWVKNIAYSHKNNLLVTSSFDGSIFTWDINSHTEQGLIYQKVLNVSGMMRCAISPDDSKLVITTTGGYMMIIHCLDLTTLHKDLCGFRPNIYRLMQMGRQYIPQAAKFDHVFSKRQKKNRVELVSDFAPENDAELITSLQIHPHGHSFLTRNISFSESVEYSCIHNLHEGDDDITEQPEEDFNPKRKRKLSDEETRSLDCPERRSRVDNEEGVRSSLEESLQYIFSSRRINPPERTFASLEPPVRQIPLPRYRLGDRNRVNLISPLAITAQTSATTNTTNRNTLANQTSSSNTLTTASSSRAISTANRLQAASTQTRPDAYVPDIWAAEVTVQERSMRQSARARNNSSVSAFNYVYAISSGVLPFSNNNTSESSVHSNRNTSVQNRTNDGEANNETSSHENETENILNVTDSSSDTESSDDSSSTSTDDSMPSPNVLFSPIGRTRNLPQSATSSDNRKYIFQNREKLMYFIEESNASKSIIKEPSYSYDGRIICSPFDKGVRLIGYTHECSEHVRYESPPKELYVLKTINAHSDVVLCSRFSPNSPLLVTGSINGEIVWYQPNL